MFILKSISIFLLTFSTFAAVWNADNQWSQDYEVKYSEWMTTSQVHPELFTSKSSPYYGLRADCADAVYALRAIFSFENSLPFAISNPSGGRSHNYLSNTTSAYDKYKDPHQRVIAFLNNLGESVGTENLSRMDTYPVKLATVRPGTLYTYKIKARFRKVIRHAYTIKDIQSTGSFDLLYSTQAIKKEKLPMNYRQGKELVNLPQTVWGFRRFKWPGNLGMRNSSLPENFAYSEEQYSLAKELGQNEFFSYVKSLLKTENETPNKLVARVLKNVCQEATARVGYVDQGVGYNNSRNGRCMDYTDYDIYSTPARDKALKAAYEALAYTWQKNGDLVSDIDLSTIVESIIGATNLDRAMVLDYCPVEVKGLATYDLSDIWKRVQTGSLSSHPNDSLSARWGEPGKRTRCKVWY